MIQNLKKNNLDRGAGFTKSRVGFPTLIKRRQSIIIKGGAKVTV